ncbi:heat shock cognate 70 kDa protein 2-like [Pyrus ussuriensis x Pyrus communis]|uniref:Heat shock cognate 70 kDa protein 2-like n=1 Tax=Pyrus ussuriensis x Pyrus communis TaxID=2448454 RepID=A0A5N5F634_9ROSA|nr:heat shock cognate 70 kDa protein 2-like [Pyrus ussuriensis x Pyrus communis]
MHVRRQRGGFDICLRLTLTLLEGKELCKGIYPEEAVAYGSAVQAAMLSENNENGKLQDFALLDVIPLLFGVETTQTRWESGSDDKHFVLVVIPRNTRVSIKENVTLFTSVDNQAVARFSIYEGESSSTLITFWVDFASMTFLLLLPGLLNSNFALILMKMVS